MKKFLAVIVLSFSIFGFSFAEQIIKIKVEGMTCKMCVFAVKKSLKSVKGVKKVDVSLKKGLAIVKADDNVNPKELLKAIQKSGMYKGTILEINKN